MPCLGLTPIDYHSTGLKTAWPTPHVAHRLTVAAAATAAAAAAPSSETLLQLQNPRIHSNLFLFIITSLRLTSSTLCFLLCRPWLAEIYLLLGSVRSLKKAHILCCLG